MTKLVDYYALALVKNNTFNREALDSISTDTVAKANIAYLNSYLKCNSTVALIGANITLFSILLYYLGKKMEVFNNLRKKLKKVAPDVDGLKVDVEGLRGQVQQVQQSQNTDIHQILQLLGANRNYNDVQEPVASTSQVGQNVEEAASHGVLFSKNEGVQLGGLRRQKESKV
ncbi:hypothetical protein ACQ4LE_000775 [Meloidogyne hapla]